MSDDHEKTKQEVAALDREYRDWCQDERCRWLQANPTPPGFPSQRDVREVCPHYQHAMRWAAHIEPLGTAWWLERGFIQHWPPRDSNAPCRLEKIQVPQHGG